MAERELGQHHVDGSGHDQGDPDPEIPVGPVAKIMLAIALLCLVAAALMWPLVYGFVNANLRRQPVDPIPIDASRPAGPLLQVSPEQEMRRMRARENVALHSYGWTDESAGIARIPVERAAELVLERGLEPEAAPPGGGESF